ncbi:MAG: acyl carrier protein [Bacilli bacterium]|nr:acyl carrier protein [Bacilli bacterium]MBO4682803.1 acyl carrier protein [Bacilli bacterium]
MDREDILDRLKKILKKTNKNPNIDYDSISEETSLKYDLGLDSIQLIVIALSIEMEFGIEFKEYGIDTFKTVGNVVSYIMEVA